MSRYRILFFTFRALFIPRFIHYTAIIIRRCQAFLFLDRKLNNVVSYILHKFCNEV